MKFESQTHYQRFMLGIICGLLPVACLLFGWLGEMKGVNYPGWCDSISASYFANSNMCMIGALCLCAFFLFTYRGYDLGDRVFTRIAAVAAVLIVAFPCAAAPVEYMGLLAVPARVSDGVHMAAAVSLFGSFALMTLTQFPKGGHKGRNILYRACGVIMLAAMAAAAASMMLGGPEYTIMICETGMLWAFSVAWIVKSGAIRRRRKVVCR